MTSRMHVLRVLVCYAIMAGVQPTVASIGAQRAARASRASASLEGDVYLLMKSGDTKRASSNTVYLLQETPSLLLDLLSICQEYDLRTNTFRVYSHALTDSIRTASNGTRQGEFMVSQRRADSVIAAARGSVVSNTRARIFEAVVDTAGTGMNAHYRFPNVPPGHYDLYAQWVIGDTFNYWWARVEIPEGRAIVRDLDNSAASSGGLFCGAA